MNKYFCKLQQIIIVCCFIFTIGTLQAKDLISIAPDDNFDITADNVGFEADSGFLNALGNVVIKYGDVVLNADFAKVNRTTGEFKAWGNVEVNQGKDYTRTPNEVVGNFRSKSFVVKDIKTKKGPVYSTIGSGQGYPIKAHSNNAKELELAGKQVFKNVVFSTCDYLHSGHAHYTMTAKRVVVKPDGYFTAHHVVVRVDDTPVFYLPVFWTQDSSGIGLRAKAGYSSNFGAYLSMVSEMEFSENIKSDFMLDLYSKRGVGFGNKTTINTENSETKLFLYGINDQDAPDTDDFVPLAPGDVDNKEYNKRYDKEEDRYRLKLDHRYTIDENWTFNGKVDVLSDIDMLEDWFEEEYDNTFQPITEASVNFLDEYLSMSLSARPQVNDFYNVVEKVPEFDMEIFRREIADSGIFYQGFVNIAQLEMKWREADRDRAYDPGTGAPLEDLEDYDSLRLDTMHSIYMPMKHNNWLNIIPRAGIRLTYYSDSSKRGLSIDELNDNLDVSNPDNVSGTEPVTNYDDMGGSLWRLTGELGFELTFKKYRTWFDYKNESLKLDGLRHIVEPYINYTAIIDPNEDKDHIYYFDDVDRIDELNFVRVGAKQRFQSRRKGRIQTVATIENYADFHFKTRDEIEHLGDLGSKIVFKPKEDLDVFARLMVGMDDVEINEFELGTTFGKRSELQTSISYLYRNDNRAAPVYSMNSYMPDFTSGSYFARDYEESHSITLEFDFPINIKTRGRIRYVYDVVENEFVEQLYELQRDMHCWTGAFQIGENDGDFRVMFMLYLKGLSNLNDGYQSRNSLSSK